MRTLHTLRIVFAFTGSLVLALHTAAADDQVVRAFSATVEGNATPVPIDPCTLLNTESATGWALHLGLITLETSETVDACSNPAGAEVHGDFVMTAANGDQLFGNYDTLADLDFVTFRVTAIGDFHITGGTGRFEGATGGGVITADGSLLPPFELTGGFLGWISY
jgi:hypothetical protein